MLYGLAHVKECVVEIRTYLNDCKLKFHCWRVLYILKFSSRDAKIAALEKTSQETEKLIAEARSEKIRHMDEVHAAQKKVADLESRYWLLCFCLMLGNVIMKLTYFFKYLFY